MSGDGRRYTRHYLNLSNGVEAMDKLLAAGVPAEHISFCRIQSSQCEAQDFTGLIGNLDNDMLVHLALGHECRIYDFGSRGMTWTGPDGTPGEKFVPRAIWWGVEWWRYALNSIWHLPGRAPLLRGHNVEARFREALYNLPRKERRRLKYYRAFKADNLQEVGLLGFYATAETDGDKAAHRKVLHGYSGLLHERDGAVGFEPESIGMEAYDSRLLIGRMK